jgi:hypothetical protein
MGQKNFPFFSLNSSALEDRFDSSSAKGFASRQNFNRPLRVSPMLAGGLCSITGAFEQCLIQFTKSLGAGLPMQESSASQESRRYC